MTFVKFEVDQESPDSTTYSHAHCLYVSIWKLVLCAYHLTGLLLSDTLRDSRQLSSCVSRYSDFNSWMYIMADLELSFWFWPFKNKHRHGGQTNKPACSKFIFVFV